MSEDRRREVPSSTGNKDHHDDDKFLKVTPNLFTPERLHLFDSLDLYASLIKCSKNIEQGERLHNISWRIINKSLLKDRNINKSKKREGVKNLYYVLNPMANKQPLAQQQQLEQQRQQHQLQHQHQQQQQQDNTPDQQLQQRLPVKHQQPQSDTHQEQLEHRPTKVQEQQYGQQQQHAPQPVRQVPAKQPLLRQQHQKMQSHTNLAMVQPTRTGSGGGGSKVQGPSLKLKLTEASHSESSNTSLFTGAKQNKSTSALPTHGNNNHQGQHNHINHHHNPHLNHLHKKEDPQTIVKGFDPNTVIRAHKAKDTANDAKQQKKNTFYIGASPSPEPGTANSSHKTLLSRQESLFGNAKMIDSNGGLSTSNKSNLFFSSEDEDDEDDTDWDDDSLYDEEEDEHFDDEEEDTYYRRQWDKLLFTKNQGHQSASASTSGNATPTSNSSHDPIKRSLLSGLFLNEQLNSYNNGTQTHNNSNDKLETKRESPLSLQPVSSSQSALSVSAPKATPKKKNIQRATLETSNVTAVGSVTPPQRSISNSGGLPIGFQRSATNSNRGSFSSIASESTRERYIGESNAPPAAQTILPTALSTHMFLPNNIHQQRMAAIAASGSLTMVSPRADAQPSVIHEFKKKQARRESMDIPSKNKNKTSLKTRVEISEEEKFSRVYTRRNL